jgi:putative toxin-antitoxin system antitoxin component (TIGR02293 family)
MSVAFDMSLVGVGTPTIRLIDQIDRGLPMTAVDRLAREVAPDDRTFKYHFVSRPTYARRKAQSPVGRLSRDESARLVRFARLWDLALKVWKGEDAARAFLQRPHMLLDGRTPLTVILSGEVGGQMVEDILGRLLYGTGV